MKKPVFATFLGGLLTAALSSSGLDFQRQVDAAAVVPEISWSIMHPVSIDTNYMKRVVAKAAEYGGVDSFELCGLEQKGINALSTFERYPHAHAKVDRAFVEKTRTDMNTVCALAHAVGKPVYFWHRENLVPPGIFEDVPELLDADGEFDLLGKAYDRYLRNKIGDVFEACPGLDGLVLTLTESEYSVLHNSNQKRYPAVEVVRNLVGIFTEELGRRGKRFILRSFGDGDDHTKIIDGAIAASKATGVRFEIETKVTEADFVPWLPKNKYLKRDEPLTLGAECDALGEFLGAGYLPAAQVHRIKEYVDSARAEGASRYAIRIDRKGFSIFDSAHEANLYAYMRFIRDPQTTADGVIAEYAAKRFGAAAKALEPVLKSELELVRNMNYVCSNLTFHAYPITRDFKYVKAGGIFSLYRENEPLTDMEPIWSILSENRAPTHAQIMAEKDLGVRLAREGLAAVERAKDALPPDEYARQHRAFANAVTLSQALRGYTRCVVAYFEDMKEGLAEPRRLAAASAEATKTIDGLMGGPLDKPYLDGLGFFCRELLREYRIERSMRLKLERPDVYDFVLPGCITDDGRVIRLMHAAYPVTKDDRIVRFAGNNRFPIGRITVKLRAPETARIEVSLDPDGAQVCDIWKSWSDGIWTVSVGKKGADYPGVLSIAARCAPAVSVLRTGRESLVRCAFSKTEDMVVNVRDLVNEWVYIVPRDLPTKDFKSGDLVHAGPDDYCAIHLGDFGFMSGNHGSAFVHRQTVKGHGLTVEAVGSPVTHESGAAFVIVGVPDADHLLLHPEGRPGVSPCFPYLPKGRFTWGAKSWTPEATSREQLYPMSRYRGFRWQTADGLQVPEGREVRSDRIDLVLEHDVLDPRGVLAYLKTHGGTRGRAFGAKKEFALMDTSEAVARDPDFMKIPSLMTVKTTYRYDGRCCRQVLRETTFNAPIREASVLDLCYCWNQGEKPWEDVLLYAPRLKPVMLKGLNGGADIACDLTAGVKMGYPPWKVNFNLMRKDATDPANPPDRFVRRLSRKGRQLGVTLGYSLTDGVTALGRGWPKRDRLYHFWYTGKMYPYVMSLKDVKAGDSYRHCAYTQFFDPRVEPDATDFYCHSEGDALVVYLDVHKTLRGKRLVLPPETAGRAFKILEKTPSVTLHGGIVAADGSIVLDVADGYGTLVLSVDCSVRP